MTSPTAPIVGAGSDAKLAVPLVPSRRYLRDEAVGWARAGVVRARSPLSRLRVLPNFLVIGAQRSGTTSLYHYLAGHPDVVPSLGKELQFFSVYWHKRVGWYRSHFPLARAMVRDGCARKTFEASPYYLYHPLAARRAAEVLPDARVIALLRDPIERAYSHHLHNVRLGFERLPFLDAIDAEPARLAGEVERLMNEPRYVSLRHRRYSYVDRGRYAAQLAPWLERFGNRALVVKSEDLYDQPHETFAAILRFLGLAPWVPPAFHQYTRRTADQTTPLDPAARAHVASLLAGDNERLVALLGDRFRWDA